MQHLGLNNELLKQLYGDYYHLEKELRNISLLINDSNELAIEVTFRLPESEKEKNLKLTFTGIEEYQFFFKSGYAYNTIKRFKFLKEDDIFYVSLDPEDELPHVSNTDRGIIRSTSVAGQVY